MSAERDGRTEKPTPKRKQETRKKGNIAKTPELTAWLSLLVLTFVFPKIFGIAEERMVALWQSVGQAMQNPSTASIAIVAKTAAMDSVVIVLPVILITTGVGVVGNLAQVGFILTLKPIKPKWSKINPKNGFKRIVSTQGLWEMVKSILKLGILAFFAWKGMRQIALSLAVGSPFSMDVILRSVAKASLVFTRNAAALGLILAVFDYAMARRRINQSMLMTKQQVKEEHKQSEGNPAIKNEIRKRQREMTINRMMSSIASASVVVTNPTHYAVAVKYDSATGAPKVVAKGVDHVAARIREIANENKVPIVEEPPLARTLYRVCDLDQEIPRALYDAVARLLAFVFSLKATGRVTSVYGALKPPTPLLVTEYHSKSELKTTVSSN